MAKSMEEQRTHRGPAKSSITTLRRATTEPRKRNPRILRIALLQKSVVDWFLLNGRTFPWRDSINPFHVLVAEVLLRQTQAKRLTEPYNELISRYPDPETLSAANVNELREWFKPLGLVNRADNLVRTARILLQEYEGDVPDNLEAMLALPGIGLYSARAILCIGFNKRMPMIDESSGRLLRRVINMPSRGPAYCDRLLLKRVEKLIPPRHSKEFNLGLLDIAAKYCGHSLTLCEECPLKLFCCYNQKVGIVKKLGRDTMRVTMNERNLSKTRQTKGIKTHDKEKLIQKELEKDFPGMAKEGLTPLDLAFDKQEADKEAAFFRRKGYRPVKVRKTEHDTYLIFGKK